ncbi:hypothetical protein [Micromonospora sp. KC207]|uniref:hypothetical protein n=1 Tax=Micromonospora sp. KC207 TaxID=2530377 RepID=UPI00140457D7|nr:hypothetical protein [Micromonospora sp. KC207]
MGSVIRDYELSTLRRWIDGADTDPEDALVVDIAAGLGASVNERPRLLTTALGYPGSALKCDPQARTDPGGCVVRATPQGRLVLESGSLARAQPADLGGGHRAAADPAARATARPGWRRRTPFPQCRRTAGAS